MSVRRLPTNKRSTTNNRPDDCFGVTPRPPRGSSKAKTKTKKKHVLWGAREGGGTSSGEERRRQGEAQWGKRVMVATVF